MVEAPTLATSSFPPNCQAPRPEVLKQKCHPTRFFWGCFFLQRVISHLSNEKSFAKERITKSHKLTYLYPGLPGSLRTFYQDYHVGNPKKITACWFVLWCCAVRK